MSKLHIYLIVFSLCFFTSNRVEAFPDSTNRFVRINGVIPGLGFKSGFPARIQNGKCYISDDEILADTKYRIANDSGVSVIFGNAIDGGPSNGISLWIDGVIPYEIDAAITGSFRQNILNTINEINTRTNICLIPHSNQADFVRYVVSTESNECGHSLVGRSGGMQEIALKDFACGLSTIRHETMHAIGFNHEHQRPDRDRHIEIIRENMDLPDVNFDINFGKRGEAIGPYDRFSIMHYKNTAFNKNFCFFDGCVTIRSLDNPGFDFNNENFSSRDIKSINELYPVKAEKNCACQLGFFSVYEIDTVNPHLPSATRELFRRESYAKYIEPQLIQHSGPNFAFYEPLSGTLRIDRFFFNGNFNLVSPLVQEGVVKNATLFKLIKQGTDSLFFLLYRPAIDSIMVVGASNIIIRVPARLFIYKMPLDSMFNAHMGNTITLHRIINEDDNITMLEASKIGDDYYLLKYNSSNGHCKTYRLNRNSFFHDNRFGTLIFNQIMGLNFKVIKFFDLDTNVYLYRSQSTNFQRFERIIPNCAFCSNDPGPNLSTASMPALYNQIEFFKRDNIQYRYMYNRSTNRFRLDRMIKVFAAGRDRLFIRNILIGDTIDPDWYKFYNSGLRLFLFRLTR